MLPQTRYANIRHATSSAQALTSSSMTKLRDGVAVHDSVSARLNVAYYTVDVTRKAMFTVDIRENNTAARCALYLSTQEPQPTNKTASWMSESSESKKRISILPVDPDFDVETRPTIYIAVRYMMPSGTSHFSISFQSVESYVARWPFERTLAVYEGQWVQDKRNGHGVCRYYYTLEAFEAAISADPLTVAVSPVSSLSSTVLRADGVNQETTKPFQMEFVCRRTKNALAKELAALPMLPNPQPALNEAVNADGLPNADIDAACTFANQKEHNDAEIDHDEYVGEWLNGEKHGRGQYKWGSGTKIYTGRWRQGKRDGEGEMREIVKIPNEALGATEKGEMHYTGQWSEEFKHGFGVQTYADGTVYKGQWSRNKRQGQGQYFYNLTETVAETTNIKGKRFSIVGIWVDDQLDYASVQASFPDGFTYVGGWSEGGMEGAGILRDLHGNMVFEGHSKDGKRHGSGIWYLPKSETSQIHGEAVSIEFHGNWEEDVRQTQGGKFVFNILDKENEGHIVQEVYTGEWDESRGMRHGHGSMRYANGDVYEGEFENDKRHGRGVLICSVTNKGGTETSTTRYDCQWVNDQRHGDGICAYADGRLYEGQWADNQRHGLGVCVYADGSHYQGSWQHDTRQGRGTMQCNEWQYTGNWEMDEFHGEGMMVIDVQRINGVGNRSSEPLTSQELNQIAATATNRNTKVNQDELKSKKRIEKQFFIVADGISGQDQQLLETYSGLWFKGKRHGDGTVVYADGSIYQGSWHNNKRVDGQGEFTYSNLDKYVGQWKDEKRHGVGTMRYHDNSVYQGNWLNGERDGEGTLLFADGNVYEGEWSRDRRVDGFGVMRYSNGDLYEGEWKDEKRHGMGKLTFVDENVFDGWFEHDVYQL